MSTNLRPQDDRLTQLLRAGSARSATFKSLVDRIEASHVIVYVAINPLMKPNLSGMLTWMTQAGGYRYLRASISVDLTPDQMIATIAHELQHAVEVIEDEPSTTRRAWWRLSAHRPAEWHRVAIALGDRGRAANRLRGQEKARRCAGDDDCPCGRSGRW